MTYYEALKAYKKFSRIFSREDVLTNLNLETLKELQETNREFLKRLDNLRKISTQEEQRC